MSFLTTSSVALITASSAGLGAAIARVFACHGVRVVINYHTSAEPAKALLEELAKLSDTNCNIPGKSKSSPSPQQEQFLAIRGDAGSREELGVLVSKTVAAMGRLDVVVSNHGWTKIRDFSDLDDNVEEEDWDRCFDMNVKSHLFLFQAARQHLSASGGSFISTASLAGVVPSGSSVAYAVTKAAQIHLMKSLAKIAGPDIRVNSVSPGVLLTDWGRKFDAKELDDITEKSILKRLATVQDVAQQVYVFANGQSTTGTNCIIDAGFSL